MYNYNLDVIDVTREKRTIDCVDINRRPCKATHKHRNNSNGALYGMATVMFVLFCLAIIL